MSDESRDPPAEETPSTILPFPPLPDDSPAKPIEQYRFTPERAREMQKRRVEKVRAPTVFQGEWQDLYVGLRDELFEKYASLGPQYRLLCDLVAGAYVQIRRAEADRSFDLTIKEYRDALDLLRKLIDQTQRYSETRKVQVSTTANAVAVEVLRIVQTHLQDSPKLFEAILDDVQKALSA